MQKRLLIALLSLSALLLFIGLFPVHGEEEIYDTVVRLHVLANSDTKEDQALKLTVRDAILEVTTPLLADCDTQEEAEALLCDNLDLIRSVALDTLAKQGCDAPVEVMLGKEAYPMRDYDSFCFPAGDYLSLRVCIGEASGQNWWCCLFPPLCLGSTTVSPEDAEDAFIEVGLTPDQYKIITQSQQPVYKVRFKLLELLQNLW